MSSSVHIIKARDLEEGHRILLKDLRVLTVSTSPQVLRSTPPAVRVKYEAINNDRGSLELKTDQLVKIICSGWCPIDQALEELI